MAQEILDKVVYINTEYKSLGQVCLFFLCLFSTTTELKRALLPAHSSEQGNVIGLVSVCTRIFTLHVQRERGKVIWAGVHIYICLWTKKYLNRTLAINSPFQTFAVGLLVEFID